MAHCYVSCGRHLISDITVLLVCLSASASAAHSPPTTQHLCVLVRVRSDVSGNPVPSVPSRSSPDPGWRRGATPDWIESTRSDGGIAIDDWQRGRQRGLCGLSLTRILAGCMAKGERMKSPDRVLADSQQAHSGIHLRARGQPAASKQVNSQSLAVAEIENAGSGSGSIGSGCQRSDASHFSLLFSLLLFLRQGTSHSKQP